MQGTIEAQRWAAVSRAVYRRITRYVQKFIIINTLLCFMATIVAFPGLSSAQSVLLPPPGVMVNASPQYMPTMVKGMELFPEYPLDFDFIIDTGHSELNDAELEVEGTKLARYFLAALTIPNDQQWVNLSPYEEDRVITDVFAQTEMGRDLLAQDYLLKQFTSSLMYPEDELGERFWERIYQRIYEACQGKDQCTELSDQMVNTFNKVWILPSEVVLYERENSVYIVKSDMKVMLEEDYLAMNEHNAEVRSQRLALSHQDIADPQALTTDLLPLTTKIIKEILIPEIEKEINEGQNFAQLRQIYNAMLLATWYKKKLKNSFLNKIYADQNKVSGIDLSEPGAEEKIYAQYLEAFKKGVYNYIREDYDPITQEIVARQYFAGGASNAYLGLINLQNTITKAQFITQYSAQNFQPIGSERRLSFTNVEDFDGPSNSFTITKAANDQFMEKMSDDDVEKVFKMPVELIVLLIRIKMFEVEFIPKLTNGDVTSKEIVAYKKLFKEAQGEYFKIMNKLALEIEDRKGNNYNFKRVEKMRNYFKEEALPLLKKVGALLYPEGDPLDKAGTDNFMPFNVPQSIIDQFMNSGVGTDNFMFKKKKKMNEAELRQFLEEAFKEIKNFNQGFINQDFLPSSYDVSWVLDWAPKLKEYAVKLRAYKVLLNHMTDSAKADESKEINLKWKFATQLKHEFDRAHNGIDIYIHLMELDKLEKMSNESETKVRSLISLFEHMEVDLSEVIMRIKEEKLNYVIDDMLLEFETEIIRYQQIISVMSFYEKIPGDVFFEKNDLIEQVRAKYENIKSKVEQLLDSDNSLPDWGRSDNFMSPEAELKRKQVTMAFKIASIITSLHFNPEPSVKDRDYFRESINELEKLLSDYEKFFTSIPRRKLRRFNSKIYAQYIVDTRKQIEDFREAAGVDEFMNSEKDFMKQFSKETILKIRLEVLNLVINEIKEGTYNVELDLYDIRKGIKDFAEQFQEYRFEKSSKEGPLVKESKQTSDLNKEFSTLEKEYLEALKEINDLIYPEGDPLDLSGMDNFMEFNRIGKILQIPSELITLEVALHTYANIYIPGLRINRYDEDEIEVMKQKYLKNLNLYFNIIAEPFQIDPQRLEEKEFDLELIEKIRTELKVKLPKVFYQMGYLLFKDENPFPYPGNLLDNFMPSDKKMNEGELREFLEGALVEVKEFNEGFQNQKFSNQNNTLWIDEWAPRLSEYSAKLRAYTVLLEMSYDSTRIVDPKKIKKRWEFVQDLEHEISQATKKNSIHINPKNMNNQARKIENIKKEIESSLSLIQMNDYFLQSPTQYVQYNHALNSIRNHIEKLENTLLKLVNFFQEFPLLRNDTENDYIEGINEKLKEYREKYLPDGFMSAKEKMNEKELRQFLEDAFNDVQGLNEDFLKLDFPMEYSLSWSQDWLEKLKNYLSKLHGYHMLAQSKADSTATLLLDERMEMFQFRTKLNFAIQKAINGLDAYILVEKDLGELKIKEEGLKERLEDIFTGLNIADSDVEGTIQKIKEKHPKSLIQETLFEYERAIIQYQQIINLQYFYNHMSESEFNNKVAFIEPIRDAYANVVSHFDGFMDISNSDILEFLFTRITYKDEIIPGLREGIFTAEEIENIKKRFKVNQRIYFNIMNTLSLVLDSTDESNTRFHKMREVEYRLKTYLLPLLVEVGELLYPEQNNFGNVQDNFMRFKEKGNNFNNEKSLPLQERLEYALNFMQDWVAHFESFPDDEAYVGQIKDDLSIYYNWFRQYLGEINLKADSQMSEAKNATLNNSFIEELNNTFSYLIQKISTDLMPTDFSFYTDKKSVRSGLDIHFEALKKLKHYFLSNTLPYTSESYFSIQVWFNSQMRILGEYKWILEIEGMNSNQGVAEDEREFINKFEALWNELKPYVDQLSDDFMKNDIRKNAQNITQLGTQLGRLDLWTDKLLGEGYPPQEIEKLKKGVQYFESFFAIAVGGLSDSEYDFNEYLIKEYSYALKRIKEILDPSLKDSFMKANTEESIREQLNLMYIELRQLSKDLKKEIPLGSVLRFVVTGFKERYQKLIKQYEMILSFDDSKDPIAEKTVDLRKVFLEGIQELFEKVYGEIIDAVLRQAKLRLDIDATKAAAIENQKLTQRWRNILENSADQLNSEKIETIQEGVGNLEQELYGYEGVKEWPVSIREKLNTYSFNKRNHLEGLSSEDIDFSEYIDPRPLTLIEMIASLGNVYAYLARGEFSAKDEELSYIDLTVSRIEEIMDIYDQIMKDITVIKQKLSADHFMINGNKEEITAHFAEQDSSSSIIQMPTRNGGIDFDAKHVNFKIMRNEKGQPFSFDQQPKDFFMNIQGLTPILTNMVPTNLLLLLGFSSQEEPAQQQLTFQSRPLTPFDRKMRLAL